MKEIKIRNVTLDNDYPQIAVSITASDLIKMKEELVTIKQANPDLVEWRIDCFKQLPNQNQIEAIENLIRSFLPNHPIIATFRTTQEGGQMPIDDEQYQQLLTKLAQFDFDIIDLEINHSEKMVKELIKKIHQNHHLVITSFHDFKATPNDQKIKNIFDKMERSDADIAKVAVMPQQKSDTLRFMNITYQISTQLTIPIVSMAMGKLGTITRVSGKLTNSIITFASLDTKTSSAPGQIPVAELRQIIKTIS